MCIGSSVAHTLEPQCAEGALLQTSSRHGKAPGGSDRLAVQGLADTPPPTADETADVGVLAQVNATSVGLKTGMPYIIRNKYGGPWFNAELSWDVTAPHPMASVEFDDPVDWELKSSSNGFYRIVSTYSGKWKGAELSWDGASPHPMASVEFGDPVDWEPKKQANGFYRILNKYRGHWQNAELSWDGASGHPRVSVEHHDPVDWEILPAFTVSWKWMPMHAIVGESTNVIGYETGESRTTSWSRTEGFEMSVSATASYSPPATGGLGGEMTATASKSFSSTVSQVMTAHRKTTHSYKVTRGPLQGYFWQAQAFIKSNHFKHRHDKPIVVKTNDLAVTPGKGFLPKCAPGYCGIDNGCQQCQPNGLLQ